MKSHRIHLPPALVGTPPSPQGLCPRGAPATWSLSGLEVLSWSDLRDSVGTTGLRGGSWAARTRFHAQPRLWVRLSHTLRFLMPSLPALCLRPCLYAETSCGKQGPPSRHFSPLRLSTLHSFTPGSSLSSSPPPSLAKTAFRSGLPQLSGDLTSGLIHLHSTRCPSIGKCGTGFRLQVSLLPPPKAYLMWACCLRGLL